MKFEKKNLQKRKHKFYRGLLLCNSVSAMLQIRYSMNNIRACIYDHMEIKWVYLQYNILTVHVLVREGVLHALGIFWLYFVLVELVYKKRA